MFATIFNNHSTESIGARASSDSAKATTDKCPRFFKVRGQDAPAPFGFRLRYRSIQVMGLCGILWIAWGHILLAQSMPDEAIVPEEGIMHTFKVGKDADYATIAAALEAAVPLISGGEGVKLVILPGIYRETVRVEIPVGQATAALILEAAEPGQVIIRGSEILDGWRVGGRSVFNRSWPHQWGDGGHGLAGRREMLFIENVRLTQVNPAPAVRAGEFYVDEEKGEVGLLPPAGVVVVPGVLESASERLAPGFTFINLDALVIRGLLFQRHATGSEEAPASLRIERCGDVILDNVLVEHSNAVGIRIQESTRVLLRRVFVDRNGQAGLQIFDCYDVIVQGLEAGLNGWRYFGMKWKTDPAGAVQLSGNGNVFIQTFRCTDNHIGGIRARGQEAMTIRRLFAAGNNAYGVYSESNRHFLITASEVVRNNGAGVRVQGNAMLSSTIIAHNGDAEEGTQLWLENQAGDGDDAQVAWTSCMIVSGAEKGLLVKFTPELISNNALTASRNLYYQPGDPESFCVGQSCFDFSDWQLLTGEDLNSLFDDPLFDDPAGFDFVVRPDSPWYRQGSWPIRTLTDEDKVLAEEKKEALSSAESE